MRVTVSSCMVRRSVDSAGCRVARGSPGPPLTFAALLSSDTSSPLSSHAALLSSSPLSSRALHWRRTQKLLLTIITSIAKAAGTFPCAMVAECLATPLWMIPGPNPIVAPLAKGWTSGECEMAGGVFPDDDARLFVMVYHCLKSPTGYKNLIAMSTSSSPS